MGFNKFTLNVFIRIALILANCFFLVNEYLLGKYLLSIINLGILLIIQIIFLIRFIDKTNLKINEYFDLIKNKESAFILKDIEGGSNFSKIRKHFNETNQVIQDIKIEKEIQSNYLNHLVNYIKIGLFSFDEDEKIQLINPEAKRILGTDKIYKLNDLNDLNPEFSVILRNLQPSQSQIIEVSRQNITQKLSVTCALFNLKNSKIKLISFQDIDHHLYKNELESWNKLIRILNHEIMNSITPITSLSNTIKRYFLKNDVVIVAEDLESKFIKKTVEGLEIIEERGNGLIQFVNNYRKLSSLPKPNMTQIKVIELLDQAKELSIIELKSKNIDISIDVHPTDLSIVADKDQISQILLNLLKNSIQAIQDLNNGKIILSGLKNNDSTDIIVSDNGGGIPEDISDEIFIPFYTTKETGSGIGLSLSKQIMKLHDGSISFTSIPKEKTEFILSFGNN